jgi:predicted ATP-grasp superfamily ATP-dependent carboligase
VVYPNDDETVSFLARHHQRLGQYYRLITPPWDIVRFTDDKKLTHKIAAKCGMATPATLCPADASELKDLKIRFPVIIKPSVKEPFYSRTRKKAIRVDKPQDLAEEYTRASRFMEPGQNLMVQELIPGGTDVLFSVGCLAREGRLLARVVVRRLRQHPMDFGHATTCAETVNIPALEEAAARILGEIRYHGLAEVEFMLDTRDGRYKLLEINARPWGWHTLAVAAGVDLPYLAYRDALGEKVAAPDFKRGVRWMRLTTDLPTAVVEVLHGRMKISDYFLSLLGKKHDAVFSWTDPLPFFAEIAMMPYLWLKNGF